MKNLIVANWKSNKSIKDAEEWLQKFEQSTKVKLALGKLSYDVAIAPAFTLLPTVSECLTTPALKGKVSLAVQDVSAFPAGSYTGAVSAKNLEGLSVSFAIVGHSERRRYFHETSQEVANKVDQCLENGITPIVCVDKEDILTQAAAIEDSKKKKIIVAYEPHEFIGTGVTQELDEVLAEVAEVKKAFGNIPVLYGASVNPETMGELAEREEISGFLVGTASLDVEKFVEMVM